VQLAQAHERREEATSYDIYNFEQEGREISANGGGKKLGLNRLWKEGKQKKFVELEMGLEEKNGREDIENKRKKKERCTNTEPKKKKKGQGFSLDGAATEVAVLQDLSNNHTDMKGSGGLWGKKKNPGGRRGWDRRAGEKGTACEEPERSRILGGVGKREGLDVASQSKW